MQSYSDVSPSLKSLTIAPVVVVVVGMTVDDASANTSVDASSSDTVMGSKIDVAAAVDFVVGVTPTDDDASVNFSVDTSSSNAIIGGEFAVTAVINNG